MTSKLEGGYDNDWMPVIEYRYQFADQSYSGNSIVIGSPDASLSNRAKEITDRYPSGNPVDVAVDPSDPARSTLEPGVKGFLYVNVVVSILFLLLGLALLVLMRTH